MSQSPRITSVPPGEAPLWVRERWVGLSGKFQLKRGFMVETNAALAVLEASHPDAARWWRQNAPHLFKGKRYFVFHESAGEVLQ